MVKKCFLVFSLFICCTVVSAQQIKWNADFQEYIDKYKDLAIEEMAEYHIPASITLAQGLLESGAGKSYLSRQGNNHFGIKSHGWAGRTIRHDDDAKQESFRAYNSVKESYEDHSRFLANRDRYQRLFQLSLTDYKGWAHGLKNCGYATNPSYANRLIAIIETYKLYEYDKVTPVKVPDVNLAVTEHKSPTPSQQHSIMRYNNNMYLYARQGDSFESIAKEVGISADNLAKYNERNKNSQLREGDVVYLAKKQKKADKRYKHHKHVVQPGESMYLISQKYGIRLSSLYKLNNLTPAYQIHVGDKLKVC